MFRAIDLNKKKDKKKSKMHVDAKPFKPSAFKDFDSSIDQKQ